MKILFQSFPLFILLRNEFAENDFSTNPYRELQEDSNYDYYYCNDNRDVNGVGEYFCISCDDCKCGAIIQDYDFDGTYFVTLCLNSYLDQGYTQVCFAYSYYVYDVDSCSVHLDTATCHCNVVDCSDGTPNISIDCTSAGFNLVGNYCYNDLEEIFPGVLSCYEGPGYPDPVKFRNQLSLPSFQTLYPTYQPTDQPTDQSTDQPTDQPTDPSTPKNTQPSDLNGQSPNISAKPSLSSSIKGQADGGLTAGAAVGIVVAVLGLVLLVSVLAALIVRRRELTEQRTRPIVREEKAQSPQAPHPVVVGAGTKENASLAPTSIIQVDCSWSSPNTATNDEQVQPTESPLPQSVMRKYNLQQQATTEGYQE